MELNLKTCKNFFPKMSENLFWQGIVMGLYRLGKCDRRKLLYIISCLKRCEPDIVISCKAHSKNFDVNSLILFICFLPLLQKNVVGNWVRLVFLFHSCWILVVTSSRWGKRNLCKIYWAISCMLYRLSFLLIPSSKENICRSRSCFSSRKEPLCSPYRMYIWLLKHE